MPKLKPISDPAQMAAVPTNEPILVLLEPPATAAAEDKPDAGGTVVKLPTSDPADDGAQQLKTQLEASEAARKIERESREAAERREAEAREIAERERRNATVARTERDTSEHDLMVGSLQSAQAELAAAQTEYKAAYDLADGAAIAKASASIARAANKVGQFEGAVAELEDRKVRKAAEPEPEPAQRQVDIPTAIAQNPNLMPAEREWLLAHQDAYGARNDILNAAWKIATQVKGLTRGTPEYFRSLEDTMGYQPAQQRQETDNESERSTAMSAPVSREAQSMNGGARTPSQVELTPTERQMAKDMGISDVSYARGKIQLMRDKKANPEKYGL